MIRSVVTVVPVHTDSYLSDPYRFLNLRQAAAAALFGRRDYDGFIFRHELDGIAVGRAPAFRIEFYRTLKSFLSCAVRKISPQQLKVIRVNNNVHGT